MLKPVKSSRFERDVKTAKRRRKDMAALAFVITKLAEDELLSARYRDHQLVGDWAGYRECHIEADWLLVYQVVGNELHLVRTGTHDELFRKTK